VILVIGIEEAVQFSYTFIPKERDPPLLCIYSASSTAILSCIQANNCGTRLRTSPNPGKSMQMNKMAKEIATLFVQGPSLSDLKTSYFFSFSP
jgi:hypothetical protein